MPESHLTSPIPGLWQRAFDAPKLRRVKLYYVGKLNA